MSENAIMIINESDCCGQISKCLTGIPKLLTNALMRMNASRPCQRVMFFFLKHKIIKRGKLKLSKRSLSNSGPVQKLSETL